MHIFIPSLGETNQRFGNEAISNIDLGDCFVSLISFGFPSAQQAASRDGLSQKRKWRKTNSETLSRCLEDRHAPHLNKVTLIDVLPEAPAGFLGWFLGGGLLLRRPLWFAGALLRFAHRLLLAGCHDDSSFREYQE